MLLGIIVGILIKNKNPSSDFANVGSITSILRSVKDLQLGIFWLLFPKKHTGKNFFRLKRRVSE